MKQTFILNKNKKMEQTFILNKKNRKYFDADLISYRKFERKLLINEDNRNLELNKEIDLKTAKKFFGYIDSSLGYKIDYIVLNKKNRKYFEATLYTSKIYRNAQILIDEKSENLELNKEIEDVNLSLIGEKNDFGTDLKFKVTE